jgi:hypothetical protein
MDEERKLNAEALRYLDEAAFASSLVSSKERETGELSDPAHMYPCSKSEVDQMADLLKKAKDAAKDAAEETFAERYNTLQGIVDWSLKRHKAWQWTLVLAALLGAAILYLVQLKQQDDILQARVDREQVAEWKIIRVNSVDFDSCPAEQSADDYAMRLASAERYKTYKLIDLKSRALKDTAQYAALRADYDSLNAMGFRQIHEVALADLDDHVSNQELWSTLLYVYMGFLLVLIPIYIITGYPRGYTITRRNNRRGCLNIFRKVGMAVAMFCLGASVASTLLPDYVVRNTDADGKTTENKEHKWLTGLLIVLRLILMVVGAVLLCLVASIVMTVESIGGLIDMFRKCK